MMREIINSVLSLKGKKVVKIILWRNKSNIDISVVLKILIYIGWKKFCILIIFFFFVEIG